MSFPKANIKRFNEAHGCAPPPGAYDPKQKEKAHGGVVDKSERFKTPKDGVSAGGNISTASGGKTPVKQLFAAPQSAGKKGVPASGESLKVRELEKEIRRLLKEHGDKDRQLSQKEADFRKHEGLAFKEVSHLKDEVHQALSHMLADLQRLDVFVVTLENNVSSYNELHKLVIGNRGNEKTAVPKRKDEGIAVEELSQKLKDEKLTVDNKLKLMRKKSEGLHQRFSRALEDFNSSTKALKNKFTSVIEENNKLQQQISAARTELQDVINTRTSLEEQRDNLLDSNGCLKDQVKQMSAEQANTTEKLRLLSSNTEELQAGTLILQQQLADLQTIHETTCRETADKLRSLEDRETIVNETTANLHERIVELQAQNEDLAATLKETGELLSRTKEENDKLEEMLRQAEANWETEKKQLLIQVEELVFEKSRAETELGDVEIKVKKLETDMLDQKSESDNQIESLTNQLDAEKAELVQLQNKLGDLVYEKSQLHMEVGHLEAQLKLVTSESEETVMEANKAMEVVPELKKRIETLDIEKAEVEKRASELSEQNETLQTTLEKFQADFDEHCKKIDVERKGTQAKIVALTEEIEGLREQKDQMASELDDWLTDKSELDIEIAKLQCRIKVLEMENDQVKQESQKEVEDCKGEIERVRKEKQQIEKDMEQYGIDLLSNAAQLQSIQSKLDSATVDSEKLQTENTSLKEDLRQKDVVLAEKQTQLEELQLTNDRKCKECDDLLNEKELLEEELRAQKDNNEDLDCRLQQTRADFLKRCDERDELVKKNEAKDKSLAVLSEQVTQLTQQLENVNLSLEKKTTEFDKMAEKYSEHEKQLTLSSQQVSNYKQQIEDYKEHLQLKCEECEELQQKCDDYDIELSMSATETVDLQERVDSLRKEAEAADSVRSELVKKYEEEIHELKTRLEGASNDDELQAELEKYKTLYEDLQAKVEPFIEQIDAFETEKQLLLGMNKDTQLEMERLGRNYAQLLGHQNQKQKIKHVMKIKDENSSLKRENQMLKEQTAKQKRHIQKLEEKSAPKRFDASRAFQHTKENLNTTSTKSPLKEVNRK
ncbi:hyaluronan mediated motility receptor-like isoform X2 [Mercenaria mercenaria]|uniref:hyaluronan mediated motility receptor-like isoform X2 n=1 Tax=Mercenaria mercenaria TaxID=6596 RepID=UPI00234E87FD|nr:hyaluronan mediated motility receptor-like isoform X2 [Mercenaria mercenaria]